jgi:hypothetical protein
LIRPLRVLLLGALLITLAATLVDYRLGLAVAGAFVLLSAYAPEPPE